MNGSEDWSGFEWASIAKIFASPWVVDLGGPLKRSNDDKVGRAMNMPASQKVRGPHDPIVTTGIE